MKGLTIRQPWVYAIFHLGKDVENRDWFNDIRGTIAVQASKTLTNKDYLLDRHSIGEAVGHSHDVAIPAKNDLTMGAIVGTVDIIGCVRQYHSLWFVGKYGFVLRNPQPLIESIPFSGQLGFWDVPTDVEAEITRQLRRK
jgi:hypothetical protein